MIPFIDLQTQQEKIKPELDRRLAQVLAHGKYILGPEVHYLCQWYRCPVDCPYGIRGKGMG